MMCGDNSFNCTEFEFVAGCNRFGLDNPSPIVTRRLATYGNEEPIEKIVERLARQYNDTNIIDPEKFGTCPDKDKNKMDLGLTHVKMEKLKVRDMEETKSLYKAKKRVSGVADIKMLDRLENAKKFESPAQVITARGISIKIKDIPKCTTVKGKAND